MGYSVWFTDLDAVLEVFRAKFPNIHTFSEIVGNAYGDFIIRTHNEEYLINHNDLSIYRLNEDWRNGWEKVD